MKYALNSFKIKECKANIQPSFGLPCKYCDSKFKQQRKKWRGRKHKQYKQLRYDVNKKYNNDNHQRISKAYYVTWNEQVLSVGLDDSLIFSVSLLILCLREFGIWFGGSLESWVLSVCTQCSSDATHVRIIQPNSYPLLHYSIIWKREFQAFFFSRLFFTLAVSTKFFRLVRTCVDIQMVSIKWKLLQYIK